MKWIHAKAILPDQVLEDAAVIASGGRITEIRKTEPGDTCGDVIDADGRYLGPGFVDMHCHGSGEHWFFDEPEKAASWHLWEGTTTMLCSLWRNAGEYSFPKALANIQNAMERGCSNLAGVHMEGPYLDPEYGSAGGKAWPVDREEYEGLIAGFGNLIRTWTFDPCQEGAKEFAEACHRAGIRLSVCYSKATPELLEEYLPLGLSIGNHIYCGSGAGMPPYPGTRQPGSDVFVLVRDEMTAELISDSLCGHVRPYYQRLIYKVKGADGIALVSDCCAGGDTKGSDVNIIDGELYGSRLSLSVAVRNMRKHTGASVPELFRMASLTPARAIGLAETKGSLEPGKDADLVLLDDDLTVEQVYLKGVRVR